MAVTWNVTCTYSQFLAQKTPTCCVSLSSFYNDTIVGCPTCACGCKNSTNGGSCVKYVLNSVYLITFSLLNLYTWFCRYCLTLFFWPFPLMVPYSPDTPHLASVVSSGKNDMSPLVQCTSHMCPIRVHWHVKLNYKEYWRVKVTITNFNYRMNYTQWNIVVQHPNFDNLTQIFSFHYKPLTPYDGLSELILPELDYFP